MLKQITLKNFKIFKEETNFPLAKINLLTGINGRGKSSLLQSLLLMRQSIEIDSQTEKLYLNGNLLRIGNFYDVKNKEESAEKDIEITFFSEFPEIDDLKITNQYYFGRNLENESTLVVKKVWWKSNRLIFNVKGSQDKRSEIIFERFGEEINKTFFIKNSKESEISENLVFGSLENFLPSASFFAFYRNQNIAVRIEYYNSRIFQSHYISADRIGAKDFYNRNPKIESRIDKQGAFIADFLSSKQNKIVHKNLQIGKGNEPEEYLKTLLEQVGEWLSYVLDTPNISVLIDDTSNDFIITLKFKIGTKEFKPSNVGFGYSYILPIIVSGLMADKGEILIVENPEAHLHPKAQSRLITFLAKVATCNVQVFVESHSEHILHGLQLAVKNEKIDLTNTDVSVLYFHEKEEGYFTQIPIKKNGKIEKWVVGFFDQNEEDLSNILDL